VSWARQIIIPSILANNSSSAKSAASPTISSRCRKKELANYVFALAMALLIPFNHALTSLGLGETGTNVRNMDIERSCGIQSKETGSPPELVFDKTHDPYCRCRYQHITSLGLH
jgi:hypothetical protein